MPQIREGDLYKTIELFDRRFELYYGYYEEYERKRGEPPIPIYPDLLRSPVYTADGYPFVTQMQAVCARYTGRQEDGFCADCLYYRDGEDLIGICLCEERRCRGMMPADDIV